MTDTNFSTNITSNNQRNNQNQNLNDQTQQEPESPYFKLDLINERRERIDSSTPEPPNLIPKISNDEDLN